jgi:hypothetical protein
MRGPTDARHSAMGTGGRSGEKRSSPARARMASMFSGRSSFVRHLRFMGDQ